MILRFSLFVHCSLYCSADTGPVRLASGRLLRIYMRRNKSKRANLLLAWSVPVTNATCYSNIFLEKRIMNKGEKNDRGDLKIRLL